MTASPSSLRVLVVDDHPIVRVGLKLIIDATEELCVAGEATSAAEAFERLADDACDVLLLDLSLPDQSGIEVIRSLRADGSQLPILVLSHFPEEQYAVRTIEVGANGYLQKESAPEELVGALRTVLAGGTYLSPTSTGLLARHLRDGPAQKPHDRLTPREREVYRLIAAGKSLSAIGSILGITINTVSTYRGRILEKMGMQNNAELIRYAVEQGLIE